MPMRSSSLANNPLAITRELDGRYDVVLQVRDNLDLIEQVAGIDFDTILAELESAQDFTGITVVQGETVAWDAVNKILTVPKGDKGDKGDTGLTGPQGAQGIRGPQGIKGDAGPKGDTGSQGSKGFDGEDGAQGPKGDTGDDLTLTQITYNGNGTFNWSFSDGTTYVTPDLKGPKGDTGDQGIKGDQGISVHHLKGTSTTNPNGDFGTSPFKDTYTFYGDADETLNLGWFVVTNGVSDSMSASVYDTNGNGVVNNSERLDGELPSHYVNVATDQTVAGNKTFAGNVTVQGDLTISGNVVSVDVETVTLKDNLIVLNNGEVGTGVTAGEAGIVVDRGTETDYKFVFDEISDSFKVGQEGSLQKVATREDTPVEGGVAVWDTVDNRFETTKNVPVDSVIIGGHAVSWNADESTLDVALGAAKLQVGQEQLIRVTNNSGVAINNGTAVMATGTLGNSGRITVAKANLTQSNAKYILGIVTETIASGADGFVTAFGKVRGIQTNGANYGETWVDGDVLYVKDSGNGALTKVVPTDTQVKLPVAIVISAHGSNGTLFVRVNSIDENHAKVELATKVNKNANITAGTATKVTYDTKGLITAGTALSAGDIPVLDAGKITTGTLPVVIGGTGTTTSTGTGSVVLSSSPVLVTPNIGVATGTSFNSITGLASVAPLAAGTAVVGVSTLTARQDHVHPIQTTVSGNANTATTLATARNITLSGDVTGTASFNGSADALITATVADNSHNHTITNVAGLQAALDAKVDDLEKGSANGVATLDVNGKVTLTQIPDSVLGQLEYMGTWDFTTVLPTATQKGQYWISSISGNGYAVGDWSVWNGTAFDKVDNTDAVSSVAGRTGNVVLAKSDVGLANVDNTADSAKPVSTAQQTALNLKANLASPVFTGNVTGLGVATGTSFNSITGLSSVVGTTSGTAAVGTSTTVARADHVHPVQTTITGNASTATALQTSRNIGGVAFNGTSDITLPGVNATGNQATTGNAGTATKLATTRNIALTGDITGNVDFDGTANVSIATTIAANSVALGTDTTGNYVAGNTAGTGIAVTGTAGEGWSPTIALTNVGTAGTYKSVTTDAQGRITSGTNPTTLSGYGITDAQTASRTTATFTTVANTWYRIATSVVGIDRNSAEFVVDWTVSGAHGSTRFAAGCHYGEAAGVSLMQTNYSKNGTAGITEARIVYHTTYSGNYAYVEVKFAGALTNVIVNVEMQDTIGWSLVSPSTAGSVPAGYTSYLHTFVPSAAITAGTYPKVTINQEGKVTSGTTLVATDIPVLDASKITTGTLPVTRGGTGVTTSTGTGNVVLSTSPTLVTPNIGAATATSVSSTGAISGGGITSTGNNGFKNDAYVLNSRNPIWSFGNALTYGISYYQASAGIGNKDTIAFDFGTNTSAAAKFYVTSDGNLSASGSISSNGVVIGTLAEFTAALG